LDVFVFRSGENSSPSESQIIRGSGVFSSARFLPGFGAEGIQASHRAAPAISPLVPALD
jgi:hypothetical protein